MTANRGSAAIARAALVRRCGSIALTVLAVLDPGSASAQGIATSDAWLAAVRAHAPGAIDDAVITVSRWPPRVALATVRKGIRETTDPAVLQRALVLHADAAIAERAAFEAGRRVRPGRGTPLLVDARAVGGDLPRSPHWDIGREIASALVTRPGGRAMVQHWYHATAALLQQWADCVALRRHLDAALRLLPDDPVLLLYVATLHQTYADPRVQRFFRASSDVPYEQSTGIGVRRDAQGFELDPGFADRRRAVAEGQVGTAADELGLAERELRRVIELDMSLVEARIRLAHVLAAKGQPGEALPLAEAALASPLPPFLEYYAAMVLGWSADALNRPADARKAFERAASVFPMAQSARVAISRHALVNARPADALAAIVAANGPEASRAAGDPWWSYFRVHEPNATAQLATLRSLAP